MPSLSNSSASKQAGKWVHLLREAGLRPTKPRLAMVSLLYGNGNCHVTPEQAHRTLQQQNAELSLATAYNVLHRFEQVGLVRKIMSTNGAMWFDSNTEAHDHMLCLESGQIKDIESVRIAALPELPPGVELVDVDVTLKVRPKEKAPEKDDGFENGSSSPTPTAARTGD